MNLLIKKMSNNYKDHKFILAVKIDSNVYLVKNWMCITIQDDYLNLQSLSDLCFSDEGQIDKEYVFYLFSTKNKYNMKSYEYYDLIKNCIRDNNYSSRYFKLVDKINYKINPNNTIQYNDNYSLELKLRKLNDKTYFVSHPSILIKVNKII